MYRIAIGGIQHETNTFSSVRATLADFTQADGWPPLLRGAELPEGVRPYNLPVSGALAELETWGAEVVPLLWASAQPSGAVETEAFERLVGILCDDLRAALPVDGVVLDLHGAMVAEGFPDGDGEILARVRAVVGANVPIVSSLDLHGNVSAKMVAASDFLTAYRTYPHVDMRETGARAARKLLTMLTGGTRPAKALRKPPFLIPITAQCTLADPAKRLYETLAEMDRGGHAGLSFLTGFPPADVPECGPSVLAYEVAQGMANEVADRFLAEVLAAERAFRSPILSPEEAVREAVARYAGKPIIIADTQDNPGAGAASDTTGMIRVLLETGIEGAVVAAVCDPEAACVVHTAGVGATVRLALGGRSGVAGDAPLDGTYRVTALGSGDFLATGPMYGGNRMQLGPMALLEIGNVQVIVTSKKQQAATRAMFSHLGVDPEAMRVLVLKSSVHFRADFSGIAGDILVAAAPGVNVEDPAALPYRHLRAGVRRGS